MGKKFKLEAAGYLNTADATVPVKQDPLQAIDVGDWCEVALIINVTEAATAGSLTFETAAEPFQGAFAPLGASYDVALTSTGVSFKYIPRKHARYLRWNTSSGLSGDAKFTIDAFAKIRG